MIYFPFIFLAFFDFSSLRTHFWLFTQVMRKIRREVTRKNTKDLRTTDHADVTDQSSNKGKGAKVFPDQVSSELRSLCFARKRNPIRRAGRFGGCS